MCTVIARRWSWCCCPFVNYDVPLPTLTGIFTGETDATTSRAGGYFFVYLVAYPIHQSKVAHCDTILCWNSMIHDKRHHTVQYDYSKLTVRYIQYRYCVLHQYMNYK